MQAAEFHTEKLYENVRAGMVHSKWNLKSQIEKKQWSCKALSLLGDLTQFINRERKQISSIGFTWRAFLRTRGTTSAFFKIEVNRCWDFIWFSQAGRNTSTKTQSTTTTHALSQRVYLTFLLLLVLSPTLFSTLVKWRRNKRICLLKLVHLVY